MIVTEDDKQYILPASPSSMMALVALSQANDSTTVLAWDPTNRTLIAANIVGTMPWTETR